MSKFKTAPCDVILVPKLVDRYWKFDIRDPLAFFSEIKINIHFLLEYNPPQLYAITDFVLYIRYIYIYIYSVIKKMDSISYVYVSLTIHGM